VSRSGSASVGHELAKETSIRFLFTQRLVAYAEEKFLLREYGQQVRVFFSASPPVMQKQLNGCISDSFYRHLFMNPCLSGWSKGEEKHGYMKLCHKVLSRSQINGIAKLKEAGKRLLMQFLGPMTLLFYRRDHFMCQSCNLTGVQGSAKRKLADHGCAA